MKTCWDCGEETAADSLHECPICHNKFCSKFCFDEDWSACNDCVAEVIENAKAAGKKRCKVTVTVDQVDELIEHLKPRADAAERRVQCDDGKRHDMLPPEWWAFHGKGHREQLRRWSSFLQCAQQLRQLLRERGSHG